MRGCFCCERLAKGSSIVFFKRATYRGVLFRNVNEIISAIVATPRPPRVRIDCFLHGWERNSKTEGVTSIHLTIVWRRKEWRAQWKVGSVSHLPLSDSWSRFHRILLWRSSCFLGWGHCIWTHRSSPHAENKMRVKEHSKPKRNIRVKEKLSVHWRLKQMVCMASIAKNQLIPLIPLNQA
jgi:hypothetical protein